MARDQMTPAERFDRVIGALAFAALLAFGLTGALAPVLFPDMGIDMTQIVA